MLQVDEARIPLSQTPYFDHFRRRAEQANAAILSVDGDRFVRR